MKYAEVLNGFVRYIGEDEHLPVAAPPLVIVDVTAVTPAPQIGWAYVPETGFAEATVAAPERIYTRNDIRAMLSIDSQIQFDKLQALIESDQLSTLVADPDAQAQDQAPGVTLRDLLRTTINSFKDAERLRSNNPRFIDSVNLLTAVGIITAAEEQVLIG